MFSLEDINILTYACPSNARHLTPSTRLRAEPRSTLAEKFVGASQGPLPFKTRDPEGRRNGARVCAIKAAGDIEAYSRESVKGRGEKEMNGEVGEIIVGCNRRKE